MKLQIWRKDDSLWYIVRLKNEGEWEIVSIGFKGYREAEKHLKETA